MQFFAAELVSGRVIAEVPFNDFKYSRVLNRAGGWSAKLPVDQADPNVLVPNLVAIWVDRGGGVLDFGGVLYDLETDTDTVSCGGQGIFSRYEDNRITLGSRAGMIGAKDFDVLDSEINWESVDPLLIITDCIRHANTYGDDDIGTEVVLVETGIGDETNLPPLPAEYKFDTWEGKGIGDVIRELSDRDGGIDFDMDGYISDGAIVPRLHVHYPQRGRRLDVTLEVGKNVTSVKYAANGGAQRNSATVYGEGEGAGMLTATVFAPELIEPAGRFPVLQRHENRKDLKTQTDVNFAAVGELTASLNLAETLKATVEETVDTPLGSFTTGDEVFVAADHPMFDDGWWRLFAYDVTVQDTGHLKIDVDMGRVADA